MKRISFIKFEAIKRIVLASLPVIVILAALQSPKWLSSAQSLQNNDVISSDGALIVRQKEEIVCATCHEQVVSDFAKTVHGKAPSKWDVTGNKGGDYSSAQTCIACHGDPTEHINSGGDVTKIKNPAKLNQKESVRPPDKSRLVREPVD